MTGQVDFKVMHVLGMGLKISEKVKITAKGAGELTFRSNQTTQINNRIEYYWVKNSRIAEWTGSKLKTN